MRVEACACGGSIVAENLDASAPAVAEHNQTALHAAWRERGGLEMTYGLPLGKPTTVFESLDGPWDGYECRRPSWSA